MTPWTIVIWCLCAIIWSYTFASASVVIPAIRKLRRETKALERDIASRAHLVTIHGPSPSGLFRTYRGANVVTGPTPAGCSVTVNLKTDDVTYFYPTDTNKTMAGAAFSLDELELAQDYINGTRKPH